MANRIKALATTKKPTVLEASLVIKSLLDGLGLILCTESDKYPDLDTELRLKSAAMQACYEACIAQAKRL